MILADQLGFEVGERRLFSHFSWQVLPGQAWALEGASGQGKTSLLKILTGEARATSGKLQSSLNWCEIPQEHGLNPELTVDQNLNLAKLIRRSFWSGFRLSQTDFEKLKETHCQALGLRDRHQKVKTLSGGEQQRVSVVRALLSPWELLLTDEPVAHLDPEWSQIVLQKLREEVDQRNGAWVCVLHDSRFLKPHFTHRLQFDQGKLSSELISV